MIKEFLGIGGYTRPAEGYLSWQHLTFVTALMVIMTALAIWFGLRRKRTGLEEKNRVLITAAIVIDVVEIFKVLVICLNNPDPMHWVHELPLFLCSIQLITLPLAAFAKGRVKEAAMDFVCIFGLLGAVLGTYGAGQNYGCYPVISLDNVASGITHATSGFAALYLMISRMATLKRRNIFITFAILAGFCVAAYSVNVFFGTNYMFLMRADGTPYEILYGMVNGHKVLYPVLVVGLFLVYIAAFYAVYYVSQRRSRSAEERNTDKAIA